jgi:DNA-binding protein Fis
MSIKDGIEKYKKMLFEAKQHVKNVRNKILTISPDEIRNNYDKATTSIEIKRNEYKIAIETIDEDIKNMEECKKILKEINQEIDKYFASINNKKIGTLHGNVRQMIEKNPHLEIKMDEIHKTVINQFYDELGELGELKLY